MGFERDDENSYRGGGPTPKLTLAGHIVGLLHGRPMSLTGEANKLIFSVDSWRILVTGRRQARFLIQNLRQFLGRTDLRVCVRTKWLGTFEVFPSPSSLVRLLISL